MCANSLKQSIKVKMGSKLWPSRWKKAFGKEEGNRPWLCIINCSICFFFYKPVKDYLEFQNYRKIFQKFLSKQLQNKQTQAQALPVRCDSNSPIVWGHTARMLVTNLSPRSTYSCLQCPEATQRQRMDGPQPSENKGYCINIMKLFFS